MMSDFFLSAGSLFFAAWTAVVAALSISAFGRDLLPASLRAAAQANPRQPSAKVDPLRHKSA